MHELGIGSMIAVDDGLLVGIFMLHDVLERVARSQIDLDQTVIRLFANCLHKTVADRPRRARPAEPDRSAKLGTCEKPVVLKAKLDATIDNAEKMTIVAELARFPKVYDKALDDLKKSEGKTSSIHGTGKIQIILSPPGFLGGFLCLDFFLAIKKTIFQLKLSQLVVDN